MLAHLLAPLNAVLFRLGNDEVTAAELLGFVTGAASVWLTVRARISNFGVGIANSAFFLVLFRLGAPVRGLRAAGGLHRARLRGLVAVAARGSGPGQARGSSRRDAAAGRVRGVRGRGDLGPDRTAAAADDIAPFWDALTTAISLAAQFLLNAKKIENWAFWIAADLIYVPLYAVKRLDLTALVYVLFLGLCAAGATSWRRALRRTRGARPGGRSRVRDGGPVRSWSCAWEVLPAAPWSPASDQRGRGRLRRGHRAGHVGPERDAGTGRPGGVAAGRGGGTARGHRSRDRVRRAGRLRRPGHLGRPDGGDQGRPGPRPAAAGGRGVHRGGLRRRTGPAAGRGARGGGPGRGGPSRCRPAGCAPIWPVTGSTWSIRRRRRWPPGWWWPAPSRPAPRPSPPCWPCTTGRAAARGAGPGA